MERTTPKPPISEREFLLRQLGKLRSGNPQLIREAHKAMEARLNQVAKN